MPTVCSRLCLECCPSAALTSTVVVLGYTDAAQVLEISNSQHECAHNIPGRRGTFESFFTTFFLWRAPSLASSTCILPYLDCNLSVMFAYPTSAPNLPAYYRAAPHETSSTTSNNSTTDGLLCNSIGCPNGFTPIENAQNTSCAGDTCEASQCCEAFCSYHSCPNGYTPVGNATTIKCADSGCTTDLCCDSCECPHASVVLQVWP